jgi:hypothetical protein
VTPRLFPALQSLSAVVVGVLLLLPAPASASRTQRTVFEDPRLLLRSGPEVRARTLDELRALGVDVVKLRVEWRGLAPDPTVPTRPVFDAADPNAYPPEGWAELDDAVRATRQRGMEVFLMLSGSAPEWATAPGELDNHVGVMRPDPEQFGLWVEAVGRRYDGTTPGLPRVRMWSIWNEPNHPQFLQPLSERLGGRMAPSAPHHYRELYRAGRAALETTGHGRDTVLLGEILPVGERPLSATKNLSPILFLRELFCLDSRYEPYRGRAARLRGCARFRRLETSGLAYHPYTRRGGPREEPPSRDDATIGQIERVERALDRIAGTRRVARRLPIYTTEFGIETVPDCRRGETLRDQAAFMNEAEYVSYTRARVRTYANYLLLDDDVVTRFPPRSKRRNSGFQSGLRFGEGATPCQGSRAFGLSAPKPAYEAFRTPLYVRRVGPREVRVFGRARPRGRSPQAIDILREGRRVKRVRARGAFLTRVARPASGLWSLRWTFEGDTFTSREARALTDPSRRR